MEEEEEGFPPQTSCQGKQGDRPTDAVPGAQLGAAARTPAAAASGGQAGSHMATRSHPRFAKVLLRHTVFKPTFFLSGEPAQPRLVHPPPPHPAPSKLPRRKAAERQGRVFRGGGGEKGCPSSGLVAVPRGCTTSCSHHVPSPSSFLLHQLPPATCLQGIIFRNLSATSEPLASSHNLGCHFL